MRSSIAITRHSAGFYEKLVLNALSKMTKGSLKITLPDAQEIQIGEEQSVVKANIQITDVTFFKNLMLYGDIGFGEAYVDGLWETDSITNVIKWVLLNIENAPSVSGSQHKIWALNVFKWLNRIYHNSRSNSISGSQKTFLSITI